MIETAPASERANPREFEHALAPQVWLKQTESDGQFVEIVMPPFELSDLIQECERQFPAYAIQVIDLIAQNDATAFTETNWTPELTRGLFNTLLVGTMLERHQVCGERAVPVLPELQQAIGLAMQGRLRLTADPLPENS